MYKRQLLNKAGKYENQLNKSSSLIKSEKDVIKAISRFPSIIDESAKSYTPSGITGYCYELVKLYNQFYQSVKILPETDMDTRSNRLILSSSVSLIIEKSLQLLGIHSPKRM